MLLIIVFSNSRICIYFVVYEPTNGNAMPMLKGRATKALQADACMPMPIINSVSKYYVSILNNLLAPPHTLSMCNGQGLRNVIVSNVVVRHVSLALVMRTPIVSYLTIVRKYSTYISCKISTNISNKTIH